MKSITRHCPSSSLPKFIGIETVVPRAEPNSSRCSVLDEYRIPRIIMDELGDWRRNSGRYFQAQGFGGGPDASGCSCRSPDLTISTDDERVVARPRATSAIIEGSSVITLFVRRTECIIGHWTECAIHSVALHLEIAATHLSSFILSSLAGIPTCTNWYLTYTCILLQHFLYRRKRAKSASRRNSDSASQSRMPLPPKRYFKARPEVNSSTQIDRRRCSIRGFRILAFHSVTTAR